MKNFLSLLSVNLDYLLRQIIFQGSTIREVYNVPFGFHAWTSVWSIFKAPDCQNDRVNRQVLIDQRGKMIAKARSGERQDRLELSGAIINNSICFEKFPLSVLILNDLDTHVLVIVESWYIGIVHQHDVEIFTFPASPV